MTRNKGLGVRTVGIEKGVGSITSQAFSFKEGDIECNHDFSRTALMSPKGGRLPALNSSPVNKRANYADSK